MIKISRIRAGEGDIIAFIDIETEKENIKGFRLVRKDDGVFMGLPSRKGADGKHHAQYIPKSSFREEIKSVIVDAVLNFNPTDKEELSDISLEMHERLHRKDETILGRKVMTFKDGKVRATDALGYRFITQNPDKDTVSGSNARDGQKITWVIKDKEWIGKVIDGVYKVL